LWEAPVFTERTSVGLDVHARSVAAAAIDGVTGELFQTKLTSSYEHIGSWLVGLPAPVAVAYEAGPTGFGLYRHLTVAGIRCLVAAPSKLQKPSGDRVKTDARDAVHLARLLRLDEITAVAIPTADQKAARDLVRAREDCRGDLMRARHRLSKLLLRHGIVYYGGDAWTGKHDVWLRTMALPQLTSRATRLTFDSDYENVLTVKARRDRLDTAIGEMAADSEFTELVHRLGCLRGVSTLTGFALAVEIGDWHRFTGNTIGSFVGLVPSEYSSGSSRVQGVDHQDREHPRAPAAGRGRVAPPRPLCRRQDHAGPVGASSRGRPGSRRRGQPTTAPALGEVHRAPQEAHDRQRRDRPRARRLVLVAGRARGVTAHRLLRRPTGWWQRVERPAKHL
jgi:transposase